MKMTETSMSFLANSLHEVMRDTFPECIVRIENVNKTHYQGPAIIFLKDPNARTSPSISGDRIFCMINSGMEHHDIVKEIAKLLTDAQKDADSCEMDGFFKTLENYNDVRNYIQPELNSYDFSRAFVEANPHKDVLCSDLALTAFINMSAYQRDHSDMQKPSKDMLIRATVTYRQLEIWGITEEELFNDLLNSINRRCPLEIIDLCETLTELASENNLPEDAFPAPNPQVKMYVVTNNSKLYGSAALLYPEAMDSLKGYLGDDFYILPSSKHELIAVDAEKRGAQELVAMVKDVNNTQVEERDLLSYNVYHYSGGEWVCIRED